MYCNRSLDPKCFGQHSCMTLESEIPHLSLGIYHPPLLLSPSLQIESSSACEEILDPKRVRETKI